MKQRSRPDQVDGFLATSKRCMEAWLQCAVLALVPVFSSTAAADFIVVDAGRDNTLYESNTGALSNGAGDFLFAGRNSFLGGQLIRRGLLYFDTTSIATGSTIDHAAVTLFMSQTISGAQSVQIHRVLSDWGEGSSNALGGEGQGAAAATGDATWLHRFYDSESWSNVGGDFDPTPSASLSVAGLGSYTWDAPGLAADVQFWVDNPSLNFGWVLIGNESASATAKRFNSRENPDVNSRPRLTVEFSAIPEPTGGILGLGTFVFVFNNRRRKCAVMRTGD